MKLMIAALIIFSSSIIYGEEINTEIISLRTKFSKTYYNYDSTYTTKISMVPMHKQDENGNWIDISNNTMIAEKAAYGTDDNVEYPFIDVWKGTYPVAGFSDAGGVDYNNNVVGMANDQEGDGYVPYRQFFLWELWGALSGSGTIDISAMSYNFNNVNGNADSMQITHVTSKPYKDNPPTATQARNLWNNGTFNPFTSVYVNSGGTATKYTVNLANDITTLEDRINDDPNDEDNYWYSVHHRKRTESGTDGWDICAAQVNNEQLGVLSITYTRGSPKIAIDKIPIMVSPNPFNPITSISFILTKSSHVELEIYSINGQKISTIINEYQEAGYHSVIFNGSNNGTGIYFYILKTPSTITTGKMVLIK